MGNCMTSRYRRRRRKSLPSPRQSITSSSSNVRVSMISQRRVSVPRNEYDESAILSESDVQLYESYELESYSTRTRTHTQFLLPPLSLPPQSLPPQSLPPLEKYYGVLDPEVEGHNEMANFLLESGAPLIADSAYPGILFFEPPIQKSITHVESTIESEDAGISVSIPGGALSPDEEPVDMLIHPCFSGPFKVPDGYEPSSPAYLIKTSRRVKFLKDITIKMHHYAILTSNEDCDEMVFLSAKSTPHLRESGPVYVFREVTQSKGLFTTGTQVGEIVLQHFCLLRSCWKRARRIKAYSARLYRNLSPSVYSGLSAVFCMCLQHPMYIKYCNKRIEGYDDISAKEEARTVVTAQEIVDEVELKFIKSKGWNVSFDISPTKIKKEDIDIPKVDIKLLDYPPKAKIYVRPVSTDGNSSSPQLLVKGLDGGQKKLKLIIPNTSTSHLSLSPSTLSPSTLSPPSTLSQGNQTNTEQDRTVRTLRDEPLDKQSVLTELMGITREWSDLGMVLGLEEHEIDTIKENHHRIEDCRKEMVAKLFKNDLPLSWTILCKALRHKLVQRPDIAKTIEKKLTN